MKYVSANYYVAEFALNHFPLLIWYFLPWEWEKNISLPSANAIFLQLAQSDSLAF